MREREWVRCSDPKQMLRQVCWLEEPGNERRLRLFILTAGRRLWEQVGDEACRVAVELAWRQAESVVSAVEVADQLVRKRRGSEKV